MTHRTTTKNLTTAQRKALAMVIRLEHSTIPLTAGGSNFKPLYALLDAGLVERRSDGRWVPTDTGRLEVSS